MALQVTIKSPRPEGALVPSWSLPAYVTAARSVSVMYGAMQGHGGAGEDLVQMKQRVAGALGIRNGDAVDFVLPNDVNETWTLRVKINDALGCDVLIQDLFGLDLATSVTGRGSEEQATLHSGRLLDLPRQHMWAGMKVVRKRGSATLRFDGACRDNPRGPAGYGFRIVLGEDAPVGANALVQGSGYLGMGRSSNESEYEGLLEGLVWATRLDLVELAIEGDSELVINQMKGEYAVVDPGLMALYEMAVAILQRNSDLRVSYRHVPRAQNDAADRLANAAIESKANITTCHWEQINNLMHNGMPY